MRLRSEALTIVAYDLEARPGPWGGADFTFRSLLSAAAVFETGESIYMRPGFKQADLAAFVAGVFKPNHLVVCHNGIRYDLPFLNGASKKFGLPELPPTWVHDTMSHLSKNGYAFSKSLGNLSKRYGVEAKGSMSEYEWEQAYEGDEAALLHLKEYNIGDCRSTLQLRRALMKAGHIGPPRLWKPR